MIIHLGLPLLTTSSGLTRKVAQATYPSLFDLAPGRVCHAKGVTPLAVSSYLTVSPLPHFD